MVEKEGNILSLLLVSKFITLNYYIPKMGVVVPRGNCPTNEGSCPIGVIVLRGSCPQGGCPWGSCPRGSFPSSWVCNTIMTVIQRKNASIIINDHKEH